MENVALFDEFFSFYTMQMIAICTCEHHKWTTAKERKKNSLRTKKKRAREREKSKEFTKKIIETQQNRQFSMRLSFVVVIYSFIFKHTAQFFSFCVQLFAWFGSSFHIFFFRWNLIKSHSIQLLFPCYWLSHQAPSILPISSCRLLCLTSIHCGKHMVLLALENSG